MTLIHVPRPPKNAFDPNRPVNALLKAQMEHLHTAASKLPLKYRSDIYISAIKTEGEAGRYIRDVTEAIHDAHNEAAVRRARVAPKRKRVVEIAAVADEKAERRVATKTAKKSGKRSAGKKTSVKSGRKK
jgi:hypothetical protein